MTKEEAIFTLSDIRSEYNCFSHIEGGMYHALSMGIEALKERKHGKWLDVTTLDNEFICWVCSECRHGADFVYEPYNYCPNCGARMDGANDV